MTYLRTRLLMLTRAADTTRHLDTVARLHQRSIELREEAEEFRTTADNLNIDLDPANPFRFLASSLSAQADMVEAIDGAINRMDRRVVVYSAGAVGVFMLGTLFGVLLMRLIPG